MKFNANDSKKNIFDNVKVYDSLKLVTKSRGKKPLQFPSMAAKYLVTLQQFFCTFSFFNSVNNDVL
jgi:hypothetical protein